jgi:hypothetical protein
MFANLNAITGNSKAMQQAAAKIRRAIERERGRVSQAVKLFTKLPMGHFMLDSGWGRVRHSPI